MGKYMQCLKTAQIFLASDCHYFTVLVKSSGKCVFRRCGLEGDDEGGEGGVGAVEADSA